MNKEQAQILLTGLGDTAEKVATALQAEGITGIPHDATYCPISLFLKRHGADYPAANGDTIIVGVDANGDEIVMDPPAPISKFIHLFDTDHFPELITK